MKQIFFLTILLFLNLNSISQDFSSAIDSAFLKIQKRPPIEKLYLHLDRPSYSSGSTIWFKGYLVTATGHAPFALSKFIYVELFDKSETLVTRKKIKQQKGMYSGNIKLPSELREGEYIIQAYTSWMLNNDMAFLFQKTLFIDNFQPGNINSNIDYEINDEGKTTANIVFSDKSGNAVVKTQVKCAVKLNGNKIQKIKRRTDTEGKISFDFLRDSTGIENQFIEVSFENSPTVYSNKFFLPSELNEDFDVQFFPEGGELILGKENSVAFKAIGKDGYSRAVSGFVVRNRKDTIAEIRTEHLGMGAFKLIPQPGDKFRAVVTSSAEKVKYFDLPETITEGAALSVKNFGGFLQVLIRANGKNLPKPFYIVAHACENLIFTQRVEALSYTIPAEIFPEGITHFVLVDGNSKPVSSRLAFIKKEDSSTVSVKANKENYGRREEVVLDISLQTKDTLFRKGDFSLAVTDNLVVEIDSLADNIQSNLLLTSDLKGYIEEPAFYFANNEDSTNYYLDLLMMTQGWQRFNFDELIHNRMEKPKHFLELGQTISGNYKTTLLGKKKEAPITALAVNPFISSETITNENGKFLFNELDFPDSTVFTIQSQKYTKIRQEPAGFIELDYDTFPDFSRECVLPAKKKVVSINLKNNARERVYYEGEGRMIVLDEFVVKAADKSRNDLIEYGLSSDVMNEDAIAKRFPVQQMGDFVVKTLPGVTERDGQLFVRGESSAAEIYVDGMETDLYSLSVITSDDIAKIVVIKGAGAALYSRGGGMGGVIMIYMKEGGSFDYKLTGVVKYMPLGYQKSVDFYLPKYEVDSVRLAKDPDMRTTIFWKPDITLDENGKASVRFFTADPNTSYTYVLEGLTNLGEICRYVGTLWREGE